MQPVALLLVGIGVAGCAGVPGANDAGHDGGRADAGSCADVTRPDAGDLPPAVFLVLHAKCHSCHTDPVMNGAKFPLLAWEDTAKRFGITDSLRWQRMADVIEPGGLPHMPYQSAPQLTAEELGTLRDWFAGCARPFPEGEGCDGLPDGGVESPRCDAGS